MLLDIRSILKRKNERLGRAMPEPGYKPKYPVQTLEKAFDVLIYLKENATPMGVSIAEISDGLKMGKSSVHRILDTLYAYNVIERVQQTGKYCLGWGLYDFAQSVLNNHSLSETNYRKYVMDICDAFFETVNLGICNNGEVVIICKIEPDRKLRSRVEVGEREPLYCTALGKQFLASFSEEELEKYLSSVRLEKLAVNTIVTHEGLKKELQKVREQGYSIDYMEYSEDLICIGVPVLDYTKRVVAALSVSLPENRYTEEKGREIIQTLKEKSAELSSFLGY